MYMYTYARNDLCCNACLHTIRIHQSLILAAEEHFCLFSIRIELKINPSLFWAAWGQFPLIFNYNLIENQTQFDLGCRKGFSIAWEVSGKQDLWLPTWIPWAGLPKPPQASQASQASPGQILSHKALPRPDILCFLLMYKRFYICSMFFCECP